jgi:hypothetical protein
MPTSEDSTKTVLEELATIPDEESVKRAFGSQRTAPDIKVLQSGFVTPDVTYVLASGKVPHTEDVFYAVNLSTTAPGGGLHNWLGSGVFWTYHQATSYIHYLKSGGARF